MLLLEAVTPVVAVTSKLSQELVVQVKVEISMSKRAPLHRVKEARFN